MSAMPVPRNWWRSALGSLSALLAEGLAVGGHVLGAGAVSPRAWWVPVLAAPTLLGAVVASLRWTLPRLLVALSVTQAAVHLWLSSQTMSGTGTSSAAPMGAMHMAGMPADTSGPCGATDCAMDARMLLWHAAGTLLTALLLAHAERAFAWLLTGLHFARRPAPALLAASSRSSSAVTQPRPRRLCQALLLSGGIGRRGPPARAVLVMI